VEKADNEQAFRKELTQIEQSIDKAMKEIMACDRAYAAAREPSDQIGSHRSIWSAPEVFRAPFIDATRQLGELTGKRRALENKLKEIFRP